jgi:hypothetical protein
MLQHIRFSGTPLLCNACVLLVPPSPQLSVATEEAKEKRNAQVLLDVRLQVALRVAKRKREQPIGVSSPISTDPSLSKFFPQQATVVRKRHSRGRAIVAAASSKQSVCR